MYACIYVHIHMYIPLPETNEDMYTCIFILYACTYEYSATHPATHTETDMYSCIACTKQLPRSFSLLHSASHTTTHTATHIYLHITHSAGATQLLATAVREATQRHVVAGNELYILIDVATRACMK